MRSQDLHLKLARPSAVGPKDATLATKLTESEANYHFQNYTVSASEVDRQRSMAAALTKLSRQLSNANRKDYV